MKGMKQIEEIPCSTCQHWGEQKCLDSRGNSIPRTEKLAPQPFWMYETCKKNWGLPQNAYIKANDCKHYKKVSNARTS